MIKKKRNSDIKAVIALVLVIAAAFSIYYIFFDKDDTAEQNTVNETVSLNINTETTAEQTQSFVSDIPTENSTAPANPETTTKQVKNYELPLSINQAMYALEEHYGTEYNVNSTIEEDGINYFALYKDDEKYASVAVNLSTGEATETIMETNQKTDFYLV